MEMADIVHRCSLIATNYTTMRTSIPYIDICESYHRINAELHTKMLLDMLSTGIYENSYYIECSAIIHKLLYYIQLSQDTFYRDRNSVTMRGNYYRDSYYIYVAIPNTLKNILLALEVATMVIV